MDRVKPVWPPKVDSTLSGFSILMIRLITSKVSGSI